MILDNKSRGDLTKAGRLRHKREERSTMSVSAVENIRDIFVGYKNHERTGEILEKKEYKMFQKRIAFAIETGIVRKVGRGSRVLYRWKQHVFDEWKNNQKL